MANWKQVRYGVGRATNKALQKTGAPTARLGKARNEYYGIARNSY